MTDDNSELRLVESKVTELVAAFYRRVRDDDLIGPMYPQEDWEGAENRLRDFLIYRFGGSDRYIHERGHPRLGMRHMEFKIGAAERDRWLALMDESIEEVGISVADAKMLRSFFKQVANFLAKNLG